MDLYAILDQIIDLLRQRQRVTYRALKVQLQLDDEALEALKDELLYAHPQIREDAERGLVWTSDPLPTPTPPASGAVTAEAREPLTYTPPPTSKARWNSWLTGIPKRPGSCLIPCWSG